MKRAPIVMGATALGLVAVLSFHTKPASLTLGAVPPTTVPPTTVPRSSSGTSSSPPPATTSPSSPPPPSSSTTAPSTTAPTARRAVGEAVNYNYGILSVAVTVQGRTITHVGIASLDDGGNFRSQSIDQQSIPILEQQAMQAQSANIQGVSGASYTSAGFAQSLQSALGKVGL